MCEDRLSHQEHWLCSNCLRQLNFVPDYNLEDNPIQQLYLARIPIQRATSLFFYEGERTREIIHRIKYGDQPMIATYLASLMAQKLKEKDFFEDIDLIIPVPLHWMRQIKRGYNQSKYIAKGISQVTGLPIAKDILRRKVNNPTQTLFRHSQRAANVTDVFEMKYPEKIAGKHILLIDDVITTGATTVECGKELMKAGNVRISVISLAYAGEHFTQSINQS